MQITIKPQDRSTPEKLELELHPSLIARLNEYAQSLNGSDVSYVVSRILEQVLPPAKGSQKAGAAPTFKTKKDGPKEGPKKAA